jgi:pyruvate kinase
VDFIDFFPKMFRTTIQRLRMSSTRVSLSTTKSNLPFSFQRALVPITDPNILSNRLALSKIVATIGPASEQLPMLEKVVAAGMGIMRINFSHATYEEADLRTNNLNACREADRAPVAGSDGVLTNTRGIMLDTQGPEIRTGSFDGVKEVDLIAGNEVSFMIDYVFEFPHSGSLQVILTTDESARKTQTASRIWISYNKLGETAKPSSIILLDDGAIQVEVREHLSNGGLRCKVLNSGTLGNKKGVNMPGLKVKLPAISDKDKTDLV